MPRSVVAAEAIVRGRGSGELLHSTVGLSFWGGIDPTSARVIDATHPLHGACVAGAVLAIPSGRGSCTGSAVLLELLLAGRAPAAIVLRQPDEILAIGAIVGEELFGRSVPLIAIGDRAFDALGASAGGAVTVDGDTLELDAPAAELATVDADAGAGASNAPALTSEDEEMLSGRRGKAAQAAMRIVVRIASLQRATALLDVSRAHIDGCIYTGPAALDFARTMAQLGGAVRASNERRASRAGGGHARSHAHACHRCACRRR